MNAERIVEFVQLLRQNGIRASPGETLDAVRAIFLVGFEDRSVVSATLRATLVKRGADAAAFDRLFELYFGRMGRLLEGLEETLASVLSTEDLSLEDLQELGRMIDGLGNAPMAQAVLEGNLGDVARLLRSAAVQVDFRGLKSPLQRGYYARRIGARAGIPETHDAFRNFAATMSERGFDPSLVERVSLRLHDAIEALEDIVRRAAELEQQARDPVTAFQDAGARRLLASLTNDELDEMRSTVKRIAEKLKSRVARKRRKKRRGQLNVRSTLRRNMDLGGVPTRLSFRDRRPERPEIVVLCDVSDSVRNVSRLMLQFVHTLQSLYARVRTFVFVSDLGEITTHLKSVPVEQAVDGAVAGKVISLAANSNYGRALRQFHADFQGAVTHRTTLVVIGDGRSNHNPANAWVLEELATKARRVVWLCPEDRASWGMGDSEMHRYARHCNQVFVVHTLDDLAAAAEKLLP